MMQRKFCVLTEYDYSSAIFIYDSGKKYIFETNYLVALELK